MTTTRLHDAARGGINHWQSMLPPPYRILPRSIAFFVPGFEGQSRPTDYVLAPEGIDCRKWFSGFSERVMAAVGRSFLPVCRMSDGEFMLLFGHQPPSLRYSPMKRLAIRCRQSLGRVRQRLRGFRAATAKGVSSGDMSYAEVVALRPELSAAFARIASRGVLGIHLSYGKTPFQEHYFPAVGAWLNRNAICLSPENYVPFYFVYALLRGPGFRDLVGGRRVLAVHSAAGAKREAITASLRDAGAAEVGWLPISPARSFMDRLDLKSVGKADLCLVGAGVGKPRILEQLEPLNVPCIDAGYAFEVWANSDMQWDRPYMTPDAVLDVSRVRFLSAEDRAEFEAVRQQPSA